MTQIGTVPSTLVAEDWGKISTKKLAQICLPRERGTRKMGIDPGYNMGISDKLILWRRKPLLPTGRRTVHGVRSLHLWELGSNNSWQVPGLQPQQLQKQEETQAEPTDIRLSLCADLPSSVIFGWKNPMQCPRLDSPHSTRQRQSHSPFPVLSEAASASHCSKVPS